MKKLLFLLLFTHGFVAGPQESLPAPSDDWSVLTLVQYHQRLRPEMEVQDVVKLLYQANFGIGHLLSDTATVREMLTREISAVDTIGANEPLLERISTDNSFVRVNLRPFKALSLDAPSLVQCMFASRGRQDTVRFVRLWNEFSALVRYGLLGFPISDVGHWDAVIQGGAVGPVHHSERYRRLYSPAYRVVRREAFDSMRISGRRTGE